MLHEGGCNSFKGELPKEPQYRAPAGGIDWASRSAKAMSVTIHFKDTSTNKITSLEYEMGAVIPELGDYIVSPFNADRIALVSQVTGDGKRNPFSVLCEE